MVMGESVVVGFDMRIQWWVGWPVDGSAVAGWVWGMQLLGLCFLFSFLFFYGGYFGVLL